MIAHQHIGMDNPACSFTDITQSFDERPPVPVRQKYWSVLIPPGKYMITGSSIFYWTLSRPHTEITPIHISCHDTFIKYRTDPIKMRVNHARSVSNNYP
jgi:hypothetical protein